VSADGEIVEAGHAMAVGKSVEELGGNALLVHLSLPRFLVSPAGEPFEAGSAMAVGEFVGMLGRY